MSHIIRFHKPYGVLTKFTDRHNRATLADYIDVPDVYAAGRLDKDSEGLLILTDDSELNHLLTHPKFKIPKTYWAQVERVPDNKALEQLRRGVKIKNYHTRPAEVKLLTPEPNMPPREPPIRYRKTVPTAWLELTITEGKNRQVRRMTAAVGYPTLRLMRVAMGPITLDGLARGEWQELSIEERNALWKSVVP